MKKRLIALLITVLLLAGLVSSAAAQSYSFQLSKEVVHVYVDAQGVMRLEYALTFANSPGAKPVDFVDLGLPNSNFSIANISANVDGKPAKITSDYQGSGCCGVAVDLGQYAIRPGKTGTVYVQVEQIERMIYPDSSDNKYASFEFSPTWFSSEFVNGSTDLSVTFHLPPGVKPEEPRWHQAPGGFPAEPVTGFDANGNITYTWQNPKARGDTQYTFGASFPASYVPDSAIVRTSVLDLLIGAIAAFVGSITQCLPFLCFALIFFGSPIFGVIQANRRKMQYLPPKISIEGHGIKRGLTAVEAAVVMETPLDKVMTMILFGVVKKGAAQVEKKNPLELSFPTEPVDGLRDYEKEFVDAFRERDLIKRRRLLQALTVSLIKSVTEKMKGFSRKETVDYYKSINEKAWAQIAAAGTPEVQSQMFEEALEWTMLDKDYDDRARRTFTGPVFVPMWWGRYDPVYRSGHSSVPTMSAPAPTSGSRGGGLPGADFAASVVGGVQSFAGGVIGNVKEFTSGVTNVTNPPPPPSTRSSGGRSGGGCACACACAGCACACAGGGR